MNFQSIQYERVPSSHSNEDDDETSDLPPTVVTTRGANGNGSQWAHIENLDEFFSEVYDYHQKQGFACLLLHDVFELVQYVFMVLFTTFLIVCIDYKTLFDDPNPVFSQVIDWDKFNNLPSSVVLCLVVAFLFWGLRLVRVLRRAYRGWYIRSFYRTVLKITDDDLQNMQWQDVQHKLIAQQQIHQLCIHVKELTELDIHNRILRWKNYMIALQNKSVIPCTYNFPIIGKTAFLSEGLKFNLNLIMFYGPGAPFLNSWKLREEYKDYSSRKLLANTLSKRIFMIGVMNLMLAPFIMIYQVLYSFFTYAELIKRSPDVFGARRWSSYGRLYLRHFNELEHEFQGRLNKAYQPSCNYMNAFVSPLITIFAKNVAFFCGAILAVLLALSFYDQDVLTAEHVISFMASLGIVIKICAGFIPDEHLVFCPETMMKQILAHTHYIPEDWKGRTHTVEIREEFSRLFQYKFLHLLEELSSPVLTPLILMFALRHRAQQIVDFYRNFTVQVEGLGDVCSFAQLDVRKHGERKWALEEKEDQLLTAEDQARHGKTELSLLHFSMKNPEWKPTNSGKQFIETIKEHALQESLHMSHSFNTPHAFSHMGSLNGQEVLTSLAHPPVQTDDVLTSSIIYLQEMRQRDGQHSSLMSDITSSWLPPSDLGGGANVPLSHVDNLPPSDLEGGPHSGMGGASLATSSRYVENTVELAPL